MKAKLAGLVAVPLLLLSSYGFAQNVASEPMVLSMSEMDGVTAGWGSFHIGTNAIVGSPQTVVNLSTITQGATAMGAIAGTGSAVIASNTAVVTNLNFLRQSQR